MQGSRSINPTLAHAHEALRCHHADTNSHYYELFGDVSVEVRDDRLPSSIPYMFSHWTVSRREGVSQDRFLDS